MIVIESAVLAEPMRYDGSPRVTDWLDRQLPRSLYLTTIGLGELLLGLEVLRGNPRAEFLMRRFNDHIRRLFAGRILPFDEAAARQYGPLVRPVQLAGVPISSAEGQTAAIAKSHGFAVATRRAAPYLAAGLRVIDPWEEPCREREAPAKGAGRF